MKALKKLFKKDKKLNFDKEVISEEEKAIFQQVAPYTMLSFERLYANIEAMKYVLNANIPGDVVECGVWKGGSMMAMASIIQQKTPDKLRNIHLFDTFEGMSKPVAEDGQYAIDKFEDTKTTEDSSDWCCAQIDEVKKNLSQIDYPENQVSFIKGKIEDTLPQNTPDSISLLRLDMDWYEPTKHAMKYLLPKLSVGGVLLIDDYGHWEGCRKAVDEMLAELNCPILLNRSDYTGRVGVKTFA